jgi:quinol monooxygenase YgiN
MTIEYIRYNVAAGESAALIAAYQVAAESLQRSEHCLAFELTRCTEAPESFTLRIVWDSLSGHLEGFRKSPEFHTFFQAVQPFLSRIEEMRHYELTPVAWKRTP